MKILPLLACGLLLGTACRAPHASSPTATEPPAPASTPTVKATSAMQVVPLRYAIAAEVAAELQKVMSGGRIVADERTNSVILSTRSEAELAQVLGCIRQLDVEVKPAK